ncbi:MAG: hypothetical protein QOJ23_4340, partial [Actinomycetota bacterium]|nr:hypothetical protein [Actinomycetota bacterium]
MGTDTIPHAALPSIEILMPATWHPLDLDRETRAASIARLVAGTMEPGAAFAEARARMRAEFEKAAEIGAAAEAVLAFVYWSAPEGKVASASMFLALVDAAPPENQGVPEVRVLAEAIAARYAGDVVELGAGAAARVR